MITLHTACVTDPHKFTSVVYYYRFEDDGKEVLRVSADKSTVINDMLDEGLSAEDIMVWLML